MSRPGSVGTAASAGEGSVQLRWIDLGIGIWHADPAARRYSQRVRARGKKGGVSGCAMANRANKTKLGLSAALIHRRVVAVLAFLETLLPPTGLTARGCLAS